MEYSCVFGAEVKMPFIAEKETGQYVLRYRVNERSGDHEILLKSKAQGKHFAVHKRYNLLADNGQILDSKPIDDMAAHFILEHFEARGDTASFDIFQKDLLQGVLRGSGAVQEALHPEEVRHSLTRQELSYTATGSKLYYHWPIFQKYKETGYGSIIRATLTLHQVCSSHCHFCSTISRNRKDSISLEEAKAFVSALYFDQAEYNREHHASYNEAYRRVTGSDIRLRGLILSGGGQPNLWPHFEEFVEWLSGLDIDLGLITNGFPKKIKEETYRKFKWVRISVTPEDASPHYPEGRFERQYIPEVLLHNENITVGYSYVYGPWASDDIFQRLSASISENGFDYARLLADCNLTRKAQLRAHEFLAERLFRQGFIREDGSPTGRLFHQLKYHGTPEEAQELWAEGQCYLQLYNVFWDTTGHELNGVSHCYACDSITVLAEEATEEQISASERRFNHEKWGTVTNVEVKKLFMEPVRPYFDPRSVCAACLFMKNNQAVKDLSKREDFEEGITLVESEHVNFP